ncbi:MAG: tetratricopeptide repeat protein [Candidatus Tectomicrobia bacterium]|uniref:Tetratricopeptide repeat protein n=1 Tax=Tectimicrobiota bacterium TaxID=2528274 RepID=A0A932CP82_UNCTE|nr:tetratricopeptide repeat protein [Candidatus Tectomicrobia bacterium]
MDRLLILIFFGFIGVFSTFELYNTDIWFHLKVGELILQRRGIPPGMDFVYTVPPHPWQDSYWLFQVIAAAVWRLGGGVGLCLLRGVLIATTFILLYQTVRVSARPGGSPSAGWQLPTAFLILCLLLTALAASNRFRFRPDLFTLLLVAGGLYLLHAYRSGRKRYVWLLPLLQLLWVNSHQLFLLGLALAAAFLVGGVIERGWRGTKNGWDGWLMAATLGMGGACLLNPYGYKLLWTPFPAYSQVRSNPYLIEELIPPFSSALPLTSDLFWYQVLLAISALALLLSLGLQVMGQLPRLGIWMARGEGPPQPAGHGPDGSSSLRPSLLMAHLLIYGIFLYLSLMARRNVALFAVVAGPIAAIHLREAAAAALRWAERRGRAPARLRGVGAAWRIGLALLLMVLTWQVATDRYSVRSRTLRRFGLGVSPLVYPQKAVDFILSADLPGNLFNLDEIGHYFTWRAYPRKRSFIDGTFSGGPDFVGTYQEAMRRPGIAWDALVWRYDINYVLLNHTSSLAERLLRRLYQDKSWRLIYFDELSVVFIRDLPRNREVVQRFALDLGQLQAARGSGYEGRMDGRGPTFLGRLLGRVRFPGDHFNRGNFFFRVAGLPERAVQEYEAGLQIYSDDPLVHNNLAAIYHQIGRFDRAIAHYREALRMDPKDAEIHFNLALAYRGQRLDEQEEAEYQRALELKPDFTQARLQLGLFYLRRGERARANQELRQVMGSMGFPHRSHPLPP